MRTKKAEIKFGELDLEPDKFKYTIVWLFWMSWQSFSISCSPTIEFAAFIGTFYLVGFGLLRFILFIYFFLLGHLHDKFRCCIVSFDCKALFK